MCRILSTGLMEQGVPTTHENIMMISTLLVLMTIRTRVRRTQGPSFCAAQAVLSLRMSSSFKRKELFPITTTCRKLHKSHLNWVKEIIKFLFCGAACIIINFFFIYYCFFINSCHHNKILLYFTGKKIIIISFQVFQRLVCPW